MMNFLRLLALFFALAVPSIGAGLDRKVYELHGLPLKLGIWIDSEGERDGIDLAPRLKEFGIVIGDGEFCFYATHSRTVIIQADSDDIELFETLIDTLWAAESLRKSTVELIEHIEMLPEDKRLLFIEKQGFFPDRFVDALAQESLWAQKEALESEAILARQKLKEALDNAIPYLRKQTGVIERGSETNKTE